MTLGTVAGADSPSAVSFCSCCGAEMVSKNHINQLISESFLTVKGAALFLPRGKSPPPSSAPRISQRRNKHTGDLQKHLQTMFTVLRPEDTIRLAVRLESAYPQVTRYMVVVSTNGRQDTEESLVLGMDFVSSDSCCCSVGLVLPLWSDTLIHLDGDGGFSVSTVNRVHVFKPVSVQAMWSALQSLHKACEVARCHNYYPGSLFLTWVSYYQSRVSSSQFCINEWNAMQDVESHRANSPILFTDLPTERERTERLIKTRLREIMMQKDLENVTSKEIRTELEMQMVCNLREFKEFIDNEMIVILGQMDSPTEIFDHVFLGSEWNASNLEELQNSGVRYILNVTREIDNFFPGMFEYHNIRVYDEEATNLLEYWNDTYKFITKAKKAGVKCLVHCKMGVSRSASTVIAYAMKEYGWDLDTAFDYVKERRAVTKPNPSFMKQLEEYQGILLASKQRHNKLWRSHSDSDLSDRPDSIRKTSSPSLVRSDSHNNTTSLHHFLGVAVLQALGAGPKNSSKTNSAPTSVSVCNDMGESEVREEVRLDSEDSVPPVLPRPRAATIIPEERLNSSASMAVTVLVALPHPPPSLLILPPTPELRRTPRRPPTHLSISVPKYEPEELNLSKTCSSGESSPLTLGSSDSDLLNKCFLDLSSDEHSPLPLVLALKDDNNNPSELQIGSLSNSRGKADGSSNHSVDNMDFFSAREKFLGLAQDRREQRTPLSPEGEEVSEEEEQEMSPVKASLGSDSCDGTSPDPTRPTHKDNGVSVRHIVIEMEAISQSAASSPSPQTVQWDPQEEAEDSKVLADWAAGSVRRATEQLEQKLRREQDMAASQRSPLHSPSAEQPPVGLTRCSQSPDPLHTAGHSSTQGGNTAVSATPKDEETHTESETVLQSSRTDKVQDLSHSQNSHLSRVTNLVRMPINGEAVTSSQEESSLDTSAPSHRQDQLHQTQKSPAALCHMTVDGVTVQESSTDQGLDSCLQDMRQACGPDCEAQSRLVHSSQELERIQHTLRELQAFLQEGVGLDDTDSQAQDLEQPPGLRDTMDTEPGHDPPGPAHRQQLRDGQECRGPSEPARWHRTVELEARMRQAGLTPPSFMKRSASLAKLDCLQLSADDLSLDLELDLRPQTRSHPHSPPSSSLTQPHSDDTWKKQKQGRGHSSRRSRKASAERKQRCLLYNTM
ncbi:protein phosphatase Slingshot homolog 2 [Nematolebias whitei]|uniref:protein phosphatase Slingshot homolog 2 n=1 Tax=Nematolebias whitei TaxID=451745 RepID=UPI00189A949F|nr:protein phosphatase Slingshot homolog 2 [Nematolebias whitei]